ncbi:hypothetical protein HDK77DRAFT_308663 [Phyllosticta capitalensis]
MSVLKMEMVAVVVEGLVVFAVGAGCGPARIRVWALGESVPYSQCSQWMRCDAMRCDAMRIARPRHFTSQTVNSDISNFCPIRFLVQHFCFCRLSLARLMPRAEPATRRNLDINDRHTTGSHR